MTELSGGEIAGIVIGSLIGGVIVIGLILYLLRKWLRGPTKGSDVNVNLDNKVVVITGKISMYTELILFIHQTEIM